MNVEWISSFFHEFGVRDGLLILSFVFFGLVFWWSLRNIAKPLTKRHIEFLDATIHNSTKIANAVVEMKDTTHELKKLNEKQKEFFDSFNRRMELIEQFIVNVKSVNSVSRNS